MKKIILSAAVMMAVVSCQKVTEGGNQGVIRTEKGVERYDDHETRGGEHATHEKNTKKSSVEVEVKGEKIHAYQGGLEEQMVNYLNTGAYEKATDDSQLKDKWFDFDDVNFKTGSTSILTPGSEKQLENLATILKAYPNVKVKIGGYTDKTGDEETNKKISQGRAEHIRTVLNQLGVGAQVVSAEGYGSQFAKVPTEATDEERSSDRKMAVRFTK